MQQHNILLPHLHRQIVRLCPRQTGTWCTKILRICRNSWSSPIGDRSCSCTMELLQEPLRSVCRPGTCSILPENRSAHPPKGKARISRVSFGSGSAVSHAPCFPLRAHRKHRKQEVRGIRAYGWYSLLIFPECTSYRRKYYIHPGMRITEHRFSLSNIPKSNYNSL